MDIVFFSCKKYQALFSVTEWQIWTLYKKPILLLPLLFVTEQRDIVGLDEKGGRILLLAAEADIDEALSVRKSVLRR